ncbi:LuxR family transcriptional regulator [Agrobacterium tumefaciens]|jgi:DNA-binding CsgD family transcriptional regulator|uniref:LuxR family transcriptional regulator n=1 Tax=Agrobacterium tumefaciens TaxID=358 RepID=UPI00157406EC|nr:LuxR family transcriptional regulator [Agrobacterium tumefaciens]NSZ03264.1 LuxR family transcriptional regulator [Agrobacterium tumefaciens]NSZ36677.1 LuxR family transcriptional regulator [Agrobacterium tumefaciens]NTB24714.1 LuxR family transcriptional regulator [Agrobacterium tumefaciens]NTB27540.1 LuxR family transcriptional regulator [Agrobacterium tumefaciens]NTB35652.1 LuxR family transcriptional regulator [Agrobacterium tumefaciens]
MGIYGHDDGDVDLPELLSAIAALASASEIPAVLARLTERYGLVSLAYLGSEVTGRPEKSPYLAVTYSAEWVEHYKAQRFVEIDPVIQVGLRRILPIDWEEFDRNDKKVRRLFGEASDFGLGIRGISIPVHGRSGDRALLSITSNADARQWKHLKLGYIRDFQLIATYLHHAVLRLQGGLAPEYAPLSPRERECLLWIGEGKTYWECARILGLSEHTVRFYLESARHKLGAANTTHAISKAVKASLLSRLP